MKKTLLYITVSCLMIVMLCSCVGKIHIHIHRYSEWRVAEKATCSSTGTEERYCDCGKKQTRTIPKTDHQFGSDGVCIICNFADEGEPTPTATPTATQKPTPTPTATPTATQKPTPTPTATPTATQKPTPTPTAAPTATPKPTPTPTATPTATPIPTPTPTPTPEGPKSYTRVDVNGNESSSGQYLLFGSYPQSEVTDPATKAALTNVAGDTSSWTSYKYYTYGSRSDSMFYKDVELNGERFRGVYLSVYRPYYSTGRSNASLSWQDDNGYNEKTVYWFKYEPIKWRILEEKGGDAFLLAEMILDVQEYNAKNGGKSSTLYIESEIRQWLNDSFYNTAFTEEEKISIKSTDVDNSAASTGKSSNPFVCENTNDKIFLLSKAEAANVNYGFAKGTGSNPARVKALTAYAMAQGANCTAGHGYWSLRSPCYDFFETNAVVLRIKNDGSIVDGEPDYTSGIVPALNLVM